MARNIRYYLARVLKRSNLTTDRIVLAMREPVTVEYRGTRYSFVDYKEVRSDNGALGFYAKLAKYKQQGAVEVVREEQHASAETSVPNLIDAASPFVYLPSFSGLAYRHIWNSFPSDRFERVFKELIESKYDKFFVGCDIEPITNLQTFAARLAKLERITELQATVVAPNPLFGPCWKSLSEYVRQRELDEAQIKEQASAGIRTRLPAIADAVLRETEGTQLPELMEPLLDGVGDAALLMAADGYGRGRVKGTEDGKEVVIRTSENQRSFAFEGEPTPELLFEEAHRAFTQLNDEQGLEHP